MGVPARGATLEIQLVADVARLQRDMSAMRRSVGAANDNMADSFRRTSRAARDAGAEMGGITGIVGTLKRAASGLLVVLGIRELGRMSDQWSDMRARLTNATGSVENAEAALGRLSEVARRSYSPVAQTTETFIQQSTALNALGVSTQVQLDLVETLNNALVISATRGERAASVMTAWEKAMALGKLSGDELNNVISNSTRLSQALADQLGIKVTRLREVGAEGKITRAVMVGITTQLEQLRKEAEDMPATLADGFTLLKDSLLQTIGRFDQTLGVSESLARAMVVLADNMDMVAASAAAVGAAFVAVKLFQALAFVRQLVLLERALGATSTASALFGAAAKRAQLAWIALNATMLLNPFVLAAAAIAAVTALLYANADSQVKVGTETVRLGDIFLGMWEVVKQATAFVQTLFSQGWAAAFAQISPALAAVGQMFDQVFSFIANKVKTVVNFSIGLFVGLAAAAKAIWTGEDVGGAFKASLGGDYVGAMVGQLKSGIVALADLGKAAREAGASATVAGGSMGNLGGALDKAAKKAKKKKDVLSDLEKELKRRNEETKRFIESLTEEIEKIGLDEKALRQLQIAKALEVAVTEEQRRKIRELNDERERALAIHAANKFESDVLVPLEREVTLLGQSAEAQARANLEAEKAAMIAEHGAAAWQRYFEAKSALIAFDANELLEQEQLDAFLQGLSDMQASAQLTAQIIGDAFGSIGQAFGGLITAQADYAAINAKIAEDARKGRKAESADIAALGRAEVARNMAAIGAVKSLFKEKSAAFKAFTAIEKAYAAFQAAQAAMAMARDIAHTVRSIANALARGAADQAAGGAKIFAQLGVYAFPVVAAMVAVLAGLGLFGGGKGGGGSSMPDIKDVQAAQGTGTVLGDSGAKSESIVNALELMAKNSTKGVDQSADMVRSLRKIESSIGNLAAAVARSLSLSGGFFDAAGMSLGESGSSGFLGMFGSKTTRSLYDQGLSINPASLQQILEVGITGATYNVIETVKKKSGFFGIGGGTKTSYSTTTGALDPEIARQFQLIIGDIQKSVIDAAKILGFDVGAALQAFEVEIGKISFKDMTGDEISKTLEAVFSKVADQMAGFAVAGLAEFQKAGEGLFETLTRLAKDFLTVGTALNSIGFSAGSVAKISLQAREALIDLAGGLEEFVSQINFYYENFLTTAEQQSFLQMQVNAAFQSMGVAVPSSIEAFKALVNAQDLTTEAGQLLFSQLMAIAPAFYEVETAAAQAAAAAKQAAEALAKQKTQLQIQLLEAQGKATEALALKRKMELEALDASLRGLQKEVWAAQDVAKAKDALLTAYKRESGELKQTADRFHKFADDLKAFRASLFETGDSATSYSQALIRLMEQAGLASSGDEAALGGGLKDAAGKFLTIAEANAGSLLDLQRARALVARQLDQAIGGAEGQATIAEQQLAEMQAQVGALVSIDEHVLTVAEAIERLNTLLTAPPTGGGGGPTGPRPREPRGPREDRGGRGGRNLEEIVEELVIVMETNTISTNKTARILDRITDGTALRVITDSDTPIQVENV